LINKNLESFAYMVAHDIKAPLRTINDFSCLILNNKTTLTNSKIEEYLQFICKSSVNLADLVDKLLDYSRQIQIGENELEYLNINTEIEDVIYFLDPEKKELLYTVKNKDVNIFTSKSIIRQVLQNIISNSIKYQDKNKTSQTLTIELEFTDQFHILKLTDNGVGMSDERLLEIFDLFNKDKQNHFSTGVGLTVVQELLKRLKGSIRVDSQLNVGSTVLIYLPIL